MHHTDLKKAASDDESDKVGKGKDGIKNGLGGQNHLSVQNFYYTDIKKISFLVNYNGREIIPLPPF